MNELSNQMTLERKYEIGETPSVGEERECEDTATWLAKKPHI